MGRFSFPCLFFIFFIFVLFFHVFRCFSFFSFCFSFLSLFIPLFSFCFPFLRKCFFLFHFVSLFSFLGCSKSVAALQDSLGKSAHSELASFALYWLVVTFPCGMVHILVMIRLRVVFGGRRGGQVLPSYQNRQISALDETADAPQSGLSPLLSLPLHLSSFSTCLSSPDSVPSQFPRSPSRVAPPGGSPNSPGNNAHSEKALWPRENHTFEAAPQFSRGKSVHSEVVHFCRFCISHFCQWKVYILECPSWRHSSIPEGKVHIFFYFLSYSFSFFQFLSVSFSFFQFLSVSVSFSLFLSFFFFFLFFFFSRVLKILFFCIDCITVSY